MSFPKDWIQNSDQKWELAVEPKASALVRALVSLPAATIIYYRHRNFRFDLEPVNLITYDPSMQEAELS